jgi:hypothetical protein
MVKQHMVISMKGQGLLGMNEITVEGNTTTHMQEITTMILEEEFHHHLDTIKTMATRTLLPQQVLGGTGNPRQHMVGVTSLHHMEHNSGSSGLMEVGHLPQGLTHSNHRTVMAP